MLGAPSQANIGGGFIPGMPSGAKYTTTRQTPMPALSIAPYSGSTGNPYSNQQIQSNAPYQPRVANSGGIADPAGFRESINKRNQIAANDKAQYALNQQGAAFDQLATASGLSYNAGTNSWISADSALQKDQINNQLSRLGLNTSREKGYLNESAADKRARLAIKEGLLGKTQQFNDQDLATQLAGIGLDSSRIDLNEQGSRRESATSQRRLLSDATGRGATVTSGFRDDRTDIDAQLQEQLRGYGLDREGTNLARQRAHNDSARQRAQLDAAGKEYGLDRKAFEQELKMGLERLGVQADLDIGSLMDKMASNNVQDQIAAREIVNLAVQPNVYGSFAPPKSAAPKPKSVPLKTYTTKSGRKMQ